MPIKTLPYCLILSLLLALPSCGQPRDEQPNYYEISRADYQDHLEGFWLGLSIANWTGLVTEMDKIGGEGQHGQFYTRDDWGKPDQPSIWGQGVPSDLSANIDWVLVEPGESWGADDDTDIEYIYLDLLAKSPSVRLSGEQIRSAWIAHIYRDDETPFSTTEGQPENYLWVSNEAAFELMLNDGLIPPLTSDPELNPHTDMIDAQLTTELFGALTPARPDIAQSLAELPIRTTARSHAEYAAQFYVTLHSLALVNDEQRSRAEQIHWLAMQGRLTLPNDSYTAAMFDFVQQQYQQGVAWEATRDELYQRYQVEQQDGYDISSRDLYCNGCFAAGINFGASIISLLYGEGDYQNTVKLAVLMGWDSDNPAATWGGLIGLMDGRAKLAQQFDTPLSDSFNIGRTRKNFPNNGLDTFPQMAARGVLIIDRIVSEELDGIVDLEEEVWLIPRSVD
ncbi:ADP-ribosylglycohydrolase family protein [uncultured Umboniibacter sp.]|uniref:ADP-ribosylglycohydrolase family protein n=1 Tax=uncultured Umboniibacter sp. TaxID=1798917 RepID=UPI00260B9BC2|nr:ADP-ribosylglycohydrolase family protein [uncultured Umboniibacter sp.]